MNDGARIAEEYGACTTRSGKVLVIDQVTPPQEFGATCCMNCIIIHFNIISLADRFLDALQSISLGAQSGLTPSVAAQTAAANAIAAS